MEGSMFDSTSFSQAPYNLSSRLPTELLSDIFLECASGGVDAEHTIYIPLLLTQICSRWRSAALANPQLWSRLFIQLALPYSDNESPPPSPTSSSETGKQIVDTWIKRSGECPLTMYVLWEDPPLSTTHPILESLMDVSHRWETMFFYLPFVAFKAFSRARGNLPMLKSLSVGTDDELSQPVAAKLDMFEIAPKLRSLESINFSPTMFKLPWAQLEDIPVLSGGIDECLGVLSRAKKLQKLGFMFVEGKSIGLAPSSYIYHQHLRSLTIMTPQWNENVNLCELFPPLTFPNLESLTICNVKSPFGAEFIEFLSKLHTLKTLHLRKTSLTDEQLVQGLKNLPSLTCLMLHSAEGAGESTTVTRYLLDALTRNFFTDKMDGMLLPRLKKLEVTISSNVAREPDFFLDMVHSRLRDDAGLARLEHIRLKWLVELDEEFLMKLLELRELGLAISIESPQELEKGHPGLP